MNPLKVLALFSLVLIIGFTSSCGEDDSEPAPTETIMEIVKNTDGLDSLEKYLEFYPDLVATLGAEGDFTLFAPTNSAFAGLLATDGFPQDITLINPDIIKNVLAYHLIATRYESSDLTAGTTISTQSAGSEEIVVNDDGTLLTGSSTSDILILDEDMKATNGVVHTVASVLIPPSVGASLTPILGTNAGTLLLGSNFTILAEGIALADAFASENSLTTLTSILAGTTKHTVFAPTNATFDAGSITAASFTGQQWYGIIANHVVMSEVTPDQLTTGESFNTAYTADGTTYGSLLVFNNTDAIPAQNGIGIYLDGNGDVDLTDQTTYTNFDAEVALPNAAENDNGTIHVIAGVLSPM